MSKADTIAAVATAPGLGAIGIVRVSGPAVPAIAHALLGKLPVPRRVTYRAFRGADGSPIDQGLALFFDAPRSFTGEHVLELQGHGGPVVVDLVLARVLELGARMARPGEFSERAFLNGKLDLVQAEAIADLIAATTATQARLANRSLQGLFSRRVAALQDALTRLRALIEAGLDFPDEDVAALTAIDPCDALTGLHATLLAVQTSAREGERIRDGLRVVVAGPPNAGKSSLLNALSGTETAIVTPLPGTTRDVLRTDIALDGLPVRLIDTAGLRAAADPIEQEGIRRAQAEIAAADLVLWVTDVTEANETRPPLGAELPPGLPVLVVQNKIDLLGAQPGAKSDAQTAALPGTGITPERPEVILCSARTGAGLDALRTTLKRFAGYRGPDSGEFSARRRHLDALERAGRHLGDAIEACAAGGAPELLAEDLRQAQRALGELTGEFTADDLLGRIFSEFCIGK